MALVGRPVHTISSKSGRPLLGSWTIAWCRCSCMACGTLRRMKTRDKADPGLRNYATHATKGAAKHALSWRASCWSAMQDQNKAFLRRGRLTDYGRSETDRGLYVTIQDPICISSGPGLLRYKTYPTYLCLGHRDAETGACGQDAESRLIASSLRKTRASGGARVSLPPFFPESAHLSTTRIPDLRLSWRSSKCFCFSRQRFCFNGLALYRQISTLVPFAPFCPQMHLSRAHPVGSQQPFCSSVSLL